ncbi:SAF domain-containing protein [Cumulibacter manganitolerans]|uniref:SAF domain-containing protein n=1 Tax=Cumulibacter manganitolerans TaxID=1884992 RepID=UPI0012964FDC|nr:SAF domain-containing protein [Cumulibacter manganitolerans]
MARRIVPAQSTESELPSPAARRVRSPRWLDVRLLIGLALVLASVVAGAKVLADADKSVTVWAVTADLAAGSTLTEADLRTVDVRLDEHAAAYVAATSSPVGKTLSRDVSEGDLLPARSVAAAEELVALALSIPAAHVPVSVGRGDRVTLYATPEPVAGAKAAPGATTMVVEAVPVADVSERSQGALSVGSGQLQVVIKVPSCAVPGILDGTTGKTLTLVEVGRGAVAPAGC